MNDIETVKMEVMPIPEQAKMIVVLDQKSLSMANDLFNAIKGLRKKIGETMDPVIQAAHNSHKVALAKKAELEAPLIVAEKYLNVQVTAYHQEIERIRAEEAEKARQAAIKEEMERRRQEEEARIQAAAELEAAGATEEAEAIMQEAIEQKEAPVEVYVPPPITPRAELNGASVKTYWSAEVTDLKALCKAVAEGKASIAFIEPNMVALNKQAQSLKKELSIPGVRAVSRSSMASTGRRAA